MPLISSHDHIQFYHSSENQTFSGLTGLCHYCPGQAHQTDQPPSWSKLSILVQALMRPTLPFQEILTKLGTWMAENQVTIMSSHIQEEMVCFSTQQHHKLQTLAIPYQWTPDHASLQINCNWLQT